MAANMERELDMDTIFDEKLVRKKLEALKPTKASGPDCIHPMVLKKTAEDVALPLSMLFRKSFESDVLPDDWKRADVIPIHKKGNRNDVENYRPVSLTSIACKLMESIIRDAILEHLAKHKLISIHQHGFVNGRSCLTNMLEVFEAWTRVIDAGYGLDVIYLDYRKAFDTVPHNRLIRKLWSFGLNGKIID